MRKRDDALRKRLHRKYKAGKPVCHICGKPINTTAGYLDDDSLVIDHVIPFALGGSDSPANLRPAH